MSTGRPYAALVTLRFGFFALLAYDLWTISLSHAPRYGVAGFNVAHWPWLDQYLPTPTPDLISVCYLVTGVLALWASVGHLSRLGIFCCALLYNLSYFWSQADSYQHHYLLCLLLFLLVGEPWRLRPSDPPKAQQLAQITLQGLMVQLALIYGFTALAKCDRTWLSGDTLRQMVNSTDVQAQLNQLSSWLGLSLSEFYQLGAWSVMLGEWFAALAFLFAPLRSLAFFIVPWFHIMVEWVGFDIELFSYYMLLLNLTLLSPQSWWKPLGRVLASLSTGQDYKRHSHLSRVITGSLYAVISASALASIYIKETAFSWLLCLVVIGPVIYLSLGRIPKISIRSSCLRATVVSLALFLGVQLINAPSYRFDYYRMWGGDAKRRGNFEQAYEKYLLANQAQLPHLPARLIAAGEVALKIGKTQEGLASLREGCRRHFALLEQSSLAIMDGVAVSPEDQRAFNREAQRTVKAHRTFYRALLKQRDPQANEAKEQLAYVNQLITQVKTMMGR